MIKTTAINLSSNEGMMVTWDIGKRCNYDCTYCDATRHTNTSPHASLEELVDTFEFIRAWTDLYNSRRKEPTYININFTGGEPTVNPNFWKLVDYVKQFPNFHMGLTTNGTWDLKRLPNIVENFVGVTVSWHAEADEKLRTRALNNILAISKSHLWLQVNVMLHTDKWQETMSAVDFLDQHNITYNPVPIGDGPDTATWVADKNGVMRRTTHTYTPEQQQWFFNKMNITAEIAEAKKGNKVGRTCCGGRCLTAKVDNEWQPVKLVNTEFKDWNCMVDWYFLHIDQEVGEVYHHQTCQALRGGKRGAIGKLADKAVLLDNLRQLLEQPSIMPVVCPNQRCGCGMCVPKAKYFEDFEQMWNNLTDVPVRETQS